MFSRIIRLIAVLGLVASCNGKLITGNFLGGGWVPMKPDEAPPQQARGGIFINGKAYYLTAPGVLISGGMIVPADAPTNGMTP